MYHRKYSENIEMTPILHRKNFNGAGTIPDIFSTTYQVYKNASIKYYKENKTL
jgi:hypothetical protein